MGYPRTMGAGLAGSTTKIYGNANVNQIQYGDKLQGLPPVTGRRDPYRIYKTKAGGNAPGRFRVFCVNQLGGIGMANKNSQFAPNADGLGWCPNRKNSREGDIGINKADRGNDAIRFQSRADLKAEFEISDCGKRQLTKAQQDIVNRNLLVLRDLLGNGEVFAALGQQETILRDLGSALSYGTERKQDVSDLALTPEQRKALNEINAIIGERCLEINRPNNGGAVGYLGRHRLYIITQADAEKLSEGDGQQRYGTVLTPDLVAFDNCTVGPCWGGPHYGLGNPTF